MIRSLSGTVFSLQMDVVTASTSMNVLYSQLKVSSLVSLFPASNGGVEELGTLASELGLPQEAKQHLLGQMSLLCGRPLPGVHAHHICGRALIDPGSECSPCCYPELSLKTDVSGPGSLGGLPIVEWGPSKHNSRYHLHLGPRPFQVPQSPLKVNKYGSSLVQSLRLTMIVYVCLWS